MKVEIFFSGGVSHAALMSFASKIPDAVREAMSRTDLNMYAGVYVETIQLRAGQKCALEINVKAEEEEFSGESLPIVFRNIVEVVEHILPKLGSMCLINVFRREGKSREVFAPPA